MAAISNRKSVLGLKKEVNEGVPVVPTGSGDFTTLQDGFQFTPGFEVLTSAELKASIGRGKDELGSENPTFSLAHYLRASGQEGVEPDYDVLLECAFGGKSVAATERDTVSGSTTSAINVDTGEGVGFQRGQALLIKDPVNGFSIRNLLDTPVGDVLALAQNLAVAPGTGVNLGKAVLYKVVDEGHPTFSAWLYRGNGGAIEMISGSRVTEMSIDAQAGQYINATFSAGGVRYHFNPIVIGNSDRFLDFLDDSDTRAAVIAAKVYKDPHELAVAIQTAMNALGSANAFTCSYSNNTGRFTLTSDGTTFSLLWNTGANTANTVGDKLGFVIGSNDTAALTYTSDNAQVWAAPFSPVYDDASANVAKNLEVWMGDGDDTMCFGAQSVTASLGGTKTDISDLCEESGKSGSLITQREVTVKVAHLLSQHDAEKFRRYREGTKTMFTMNFGAKSGGQWVPGKVCNMFLASATITSFDIDDQDGLAIVNIGMTGYVEDGKPEFFLNFL